MNINLLGSEWEINDGEYIISEGEDYAYIVTDENGETVYEDDDFERCLIWVFNSI